MPAEAGTLRPAGSSLKPDGLSPRASNRWRAASRERVFQYRAPILEVPQNGSELLEAVLWAARNELPVQVTGPPSLIANLVKQPERNLLCLHLVNYDSKASTIENVDVRLRLPRGVTASQVKLISPDTDGSQTLSARMEGMNSCSEYPTCTSIRSSS